MYDTELRALADCWRTVVRKYHTSAFKNPISDAITAQQAQSAQCLIKLLDQLKNQELLPYMAQLEEQQREKRKDDDYVW